MLQAAPRWKDRLVRMVLARLSRRGLDLARLPLVPDSLTMPFRRNGVHPVPELAELRAREPIIRYGRLLGKEIWLVTGHEEARAVLADNISFSNDIRPLVGSGGGAGQGIGGLGFTDPPDHTRLRRILTPEFTMRRLERLRPGIEQIVHRQLDLIAETGPQVDLLPSFAFPIPFQVICDLLGLPDEDRERFREVGAARFDVSRGGPGSFGALSASREFLLSVVRKQREAPQDGLIGMIIKEFGDEIDDAELSGLADGVFIGGFETTASMLALGTVVLLARPDGFELIRRDEQAAHRIVEELLRLLTVVQISFPRFAKRDLELFGRQIRTGDAVVCSLSGANRDGRLGPGLEDFDPDREPLPHLAFGHGVHRCVGAELARMELRTALPALAQRFPAMALTADPQRLAFRGLSIVYGLKALPVRAW